MILMNGACMQAESLGKAGSIFIEKEMKMEYVYDYMFHLLKGYAKLVKYKPRVPPKAVELGWEYLVAPKEEGSLEKEYMTESRVVVLRGPSLSEPCTLPPPYDRQALRSISERKNNLTKLVESWEIRFWNFQQDNN